MYEQVADDLRHILALRRSGDGQAVFDRAKKCLEHALREEKVDQLLKDFPNLYEVVITFDRFFQSETRR